MSTLASEFKKDKLQSVEKQITNLTVPVGLIKDVAERQRALMKIRSKLQHEAKHASTLSKYLRIAVIFLGAFAATREAADQLFAHQKQMVVVIYTLMALAITVIGSIMAALRLGDKASELNALVAECNCCLLRADCEMPKEGEHQVRSTQIKAARKVASEQNDTIRAIQAKATKLDVIVPEIELDSAKRMPQAVA